MSVKHALALEGRHGFWSRDYFFGAVHLHDLVILQIPLWVIVLMLLQLTAQIFLIASPADRNVFVDAISFCGFEPVLFPRNSCCVVCQHERLSTYCKV